MQDQFSDERRNSKKCGRSRQTKRFELDDLASKASPKEKHKERKSWKSQKFTLEHMDINDLRDYIAETEY